MPAFTPRDYPYSVDSDPARVPAATQAFAEAVDSDVQGLYDSVRLRPAAKAWSTVPHRLVNLVSATDYLLGLDSFQFNASGAGVLASGTRVIPQFPGFWWVMGTLSVPKPSGAVVPTHVGTSIYFNNFNVISRSSVNGTTLAADVSSEIAVSGGSYCNGTTDFFSMTFDVNAASTVPSYTILTRSLMMIRMTTS